MHVRLALENIQRSRRYITTCQRRSKRRIVHDTAAGNIYQHCSRLHQRQFGCANRVAALRSQWHDKHQKISLAQQRRLVHVACVAFTFEHCR